VTTYGASGAGYPRLTGTPSYGGRSGYTARLYGSLSSGTSLTSPGYDDARTQQAAQDRVASQEWARSLLAGDDWLIIDTETTGLDGAAEIVQIGLLAPDGEVVLETLVRPTTRIPWQATAIHGITDDHCADAPSYGDLHLHVLALIGRRRLVCYNADYDRRLLRQTAALHGCRVPSERTLVWECAMRQYARYVGQWNASRGDYRFQRLPPIPGQASHSAIADCRATLALLQRMAS
jgi:DNA polymerase III subunit epsilon